MKKIAILLSAFMLSSVITMPAYADTENVSLPYVKENGTGYISINQLTNKMSGTIEKTDGTNSQTNYKIGDKTITIRDGWGCAFIDGYYTPYKTTEIDGIEIPVYYLPKQEGADVLVPVDFVVRNLGVAVEGDSVVFAVEKTTDKVADGSDSTTTDKGSKTDPSENSGTDRDISHDRPAKNTKPSGNTGGSNNSGSSGEVKPVTPSEPAKPSQPTQPAPEPTKPSEPTPEPAKPVEPAQPPAPEKKEIYNCAEVIQKLKGMGLGYRESNGGLFWYSGSDMYSSIGPNPSGTSDITYQIVNSSLEHDEVIKKTLEVVIPGSGSRLYSILDNPNLKSQTLNLGGRKISIVMEAYGIKVLFGPVVK